MRIWVADFKFHLSRALRVVGIAVAVVAWASVLGLEAQQSTEVRTYAQVGAAVLAVLVAHWFTGLPPSATVVDVLRPFERDIAAVAKERAGGDAEQQELLVTRMLVLASARVRRTGKLPRDRRAWLRVLARAAESSQT